MKKGKQILDSVQSALKDRVVLKEAEMITVVLWAAHTHVYDQFKLSPLLFVTSEDPGCGKSSLLHNLSKMCPNGQVVGKTSEPALARAKKQFGRVTIILDQQDNTLNKDHGQLIDTLCASRERGTNVMISELDPETQNWITVIRDLFLPVGIGKIGDLPDRALIDRCLHIRMHPATEKESNWLRERDADLVGPELCYALRDWLGENGDLRKRGLPALPQGLYNRAADKWTPLLAIADLAGGDWPDKARYAAIDLDVEKEGKEESKQIVLLKALDEIVGSHWKHDNIYTYLVREALIERGHQPTSKYWPSNLLSKVGVKSVPIYAQGTKPTRGYRIAQIREAAERYLPKEEE